MLSTLTLLAVLHIVPAADPITGTWQISGEVVGNAFTEVCTIQQNDTKLTGSCALNGGKAGDLTGEVKDGKITFSHGADYNGDALTITYSATLSSAKELKGTVNVQPYDVNGDFTATPAPAPAKQ
jgi:hypothetical protein